MKVIQIYKPLQDKNTKPEHIELMETIIGSNENLEVYSKIPYWCVMSELLNPNETYQQWLKRVEERINSGTYKEKGVEGIYLYDIQATEGISGFNNDTLKIEEYQIGFMVRYDYIYKSNLSEDNEQDIKSRMIDIIHNRKEFKPYDKL